jgi:hypothetical protein
MVNLTGLGHAIGDVFEHGGRKIAKVAEAPGTRKGFTSLLGVGEAGGVFLGIRGLFGGVGEWVGDHPVESVAIGGVIVYVIMLRSSWKHL